MRSTGAALGLTWAAGAASIWGPAIPPLQPFMTFNFAVEVEGLLVGGFTHVDGLSGDVEVEEYREGGVNGYVHKLPGRTSFGNLELRYGRDMLAKDHRLWGRTHVASKALIADGRVFVSGKLTHERRQHRAVFFKGVWYEAVKNTALASWNAVGYVD